MVEQTAGIFRGAQPALTPREERAAAEQAWADEALERLGKSRRTSIRTVL